MPPPPTRRRPVALEGRAPSRCVSIVKERETHVPRRTHVSRLGFGTRIRTWIARFRVSRPASWTIPKLRRSGGNCTRAARSKSPACRFNTTDREVGPEGVKPSPHRLKAGHASLHFDPVLLSLELLFAFAFAFHGHTSTVERTRALHTPLVGPSGVEPASHCAARRLQRRSLPGDEPRALKRRKPPRFHRAASRGKHWKIRPLRHLLLIAPRGGTAGEIVDAISPGFACAKHRLNG